MESRLSGALWVDITTRQPTKDGLYIVRTYHGDYRALFRDKKWHVPNEKEITHWTYDKKVRYA